MTITSGENPEASALAEALSIESAPQTQQAEQQVPLHVVQAMRQEIKDLKEKNETFNNHLNMMQWNQQHIQAPAPQQQRNPWADVDPEDSIKVKDAMRMYDNLQN